MSSKRKPTPEVEPCSVPAYIVTFSDMITLLLTFFVLLISMANTQDAEFYNTARNSCIKSTGAGRGILPGRKVTPDLGDVKTKYAVPKPNEDSITRTINAREEELRRKYEKLKTLMKTLPSQITASKPDFTVTPVNFLPGQATLDEPAKAFLKQFAENLRQTASPDKVKLYILGLAGGENTEKQQWIVSSLRAEAVANHLKNAGLQCPIYGWGAGAGGQWVGRNSLASERSQILIAILRTDNP